MRLPTDHPAASVAATAAAAAAIGHEDVEIGSNGVEQKQNRFQV